MPKALLQQAGRAFDQTQCMDIRCLFCVTTSILTKTCRPTLKDGQKWRQSPLPRTPYICVATDLHASAGDAARRLRGDVLADHHGLQGLQRCWEGSGEAAAHALVDGLGEIRVPLQ